MLRNDGGSDPPPRSTSGWTRRAACTLQVGRRRRRAPPAARASARAPSLEHGVGVLGARSSRWATRPAGRLHRMPSGSGSVRWPALFGSPFFHPTVLFDRELVDRHGLRYDTRYEESEDYELWWRLLEATDGANLAEPLVLYRVHAGQATQRRRGLQRDFQREVATRRGSPTWHPMWRSERSGARVACRQRRRDRPRRVRSSCRRVSRTACRLRATRRGRRPRTGCP